MKTFLENTFKPSSSKGKMKKVVGLLNPVCWDKLGRVKNFAIYSNEEDIIIEDFKDVARLKKLLRKRVEATGVIRDSYAGDKFIKLKSIRELTGPNSPAFNLSAVSSFEILSDDFVVRVPDKEIFTLCESDKYEIWEAS